MTQRIEIVEVGPRDGLQSEPGIVPTAAKIAFIERAIECGLAAYRGGELREPAARAADGRCRGRVARAASPQ
jgi:hydroxymethylglutaryl-CoA lyase